MSSSDSARKALLTSYTLASPTSAKDTEDSIFAKSIDVSAAGRPWEEAELEVLLPLNGEATSPFFTNGTESLVASAGVLETTPAFTIA
jgi:hypothetical protein